VPRVDNRSGDRDSNGLAVGVRVGLTFARHLTGHVTIPSPPRSRCLRIVHGGFGQPGVAVAGGGGSPSAGCGPGHGDVTCVPDRGHGRVAGSSACRLDPAGESCGLFAAVKRDQGAVHNVAARDGDNSGRPGFSPANGGLPPAPEKIPDAYPDVLSGRYAGLKPGLRVGKRETALCDVAPNFYPV